MHNTTETNTTPMHNTTETETNTTPMHNTTETETNTTPMHNTTETETNTTPMHNTTETETNTTPMHNTTETETNTTPMHNTTETETNTTPMHNTTETETNTAIMNNAQEAKVKNNGNNPRKPFLPGARELMIEAITTNCNLIIEKAGGVLLSSRQVFDVLKEQELLPCLSDKPLVAANSVGDVLGVKHLNLPFRTFGTVRKYLIPAMTWTPEEIQELEALSNQDKMGRIRALDATYLPKTAA